VGEQLDGEVEIGGASEADGLLEGEGDKAGEKEGAEGVDVEGHEVLGYRRGGRAGGIGDEAVGGVVGVPGEAEEDGESEEGVHVHDGVQGGDVETGNGRRGRGRRHFGDNGGDRIDPRSDLCLSCDCECDYGLFQNLASE